ncbi:MAG TPA: cytochrome c-type biogenesis CcmF C-terminal domain-containing protein, partial [Candidatus Eisenbacteria bacterium]|nr:cytochrome c-type biogenesis CcmF C-terminal domain-containing protein [Candidatus Eisenbacteria bacterium]
FSIRYVAHNSSRETPLFFKVLSLWSAHEGSLLLWNLVLAGYTAAVAFRFRASRPETLPWALAVLYAISLFYLLLVLGPSRPFATIDPVPADGRGPLPLLQNHWLMAIHPPFLYLGYIGFSVPFAFAVASLLTGTTSDWWVRVTRRWTMVAWGFLTVGLTLGALWSYAVLGWGGYWAWDPVENVALLPWLTSTAFLHTSMIQERRGMLRLLNPALAVSTFALTTFGTFLTRSGVVASVHTFSQSLVGPAYLAFLLLVLAVGFGLIALRANQLRSAGWFDAALARESALLGNAWILLTLASMVLLGTLFPVLVEVAANRQVTVGAPYFDQAGTLPFLVLLALMGAGPLLAWRRTSWRQLRGRLTVPAIAGSLVAVTAVALGVRSWGSGAAFGLAAFVLVANAGELGRIMWSLARSDARPTLAAISTAVLRNRRLVGALVVHSGAAIAACAIAASASASQTEFSLERGQQATFAGYSLRYDGLSPHPEPQRMVLQAPVSVSAAGRSLGRMLPALNLYPSASEPIPTPAIRYGPVTDLYVSVLGFDENGRRATFRVLLNPGVSWLWAGAATMALGGLVAAWPRRAAPAREARPVPALMEVEMQDARGGGGAGRQAGPR